MTVIKGGTGHPLGTAGALEAAVVAKTIAAGTIPPTINRDSGDADTSLPVVTAPRTTSVEAALTNSAGFGGTNVSLLFQTPRS